MSVCSLRTLANTGEQCSVMFGNLRLNDRVFLIALHHRTDPRFRCLRDDARLESERGSGMSALPSGRKPRHQ